MKGLGSACFQVPLYVGLSLVLVVCEVLRISPGLVPGVCSPPVPCARRWFYGLFNSDRSSQRRLDLASATRSATGRLRGGLTWRLVGGAFVVPCSTSLSMLVPVVCVVLSFSPGRAPGVCSPPVPCVRVLAVWCVASDRSSQRRLDLASVRLCRDRSSQRRLDLASVGGPATGRLRGGLTWRLNPTDGCWLSYLLLFG